MSKLSDSDGQGYQGYYQFVGSTKYRKSLFLDENMRIRLQKIIEEIFSNREDTELVESTIAYNHIHVLVRTIEDTAKLKQALFGVTSRKMRQEFPVLAEKVAKGLWGGTTCVPIQDEKHLRNCISYIQRHLPDNTKL